MAELAQRKKTAPRATTAARSPKMQRKGRGSKPAYVQNKLQTKLAMSSPGDKQEQEADRVAEQVSRSPRGVQRQSDQQAQRASATPLTEQGEQSVAPLSRKAEESMAAPSLMRQEEEQAQTKLQRREEGETAQPKLYRQEEEEAAQTKLHRQEEEEAAQTKLYRQEEEEAAQTKLHRQEEEEAAQTKLYRQEEAQTALQREAGQMPTEQEETQAASDSQVPPEVEQRIEEQRGKGAALEDAVRAEMEEKIGADFSAVVVHTDGVADEMCKAINARAFTVGNDVFFASGEYAPDTEAGRKLLAHELTHVVQQSSGIARKLMREENGSGASSDSTEDPERILKTFHLPAVKARHLQVYQAWASRGALKRAAGYARGKPKQIKVWQEHFWDKMQNIEHLGLHEEFKGTKKIETPSGKEIRGRRKTLLKKLTIPDWDRDGKKLESTTEVDHIVELQTGGWPAATTPNEIQNMECLDKSSNATAGSRTKTNIEKTVRNYLKAKGETDTQAEAQKYMAAHDVVFDRVVMGQGEMAGSTVNSVWWSRDDIQQGSHLQKAKSNGNEAEPGTPESFALMTPDDGMVMGEFGQGKDVLEYPVEGDAKAGMVAGLRISQLSLTPGYDSKQPGMGIGNLTATWDLPDDFSAPADPFQVPLKKSESQYAGYAGDLPGVDTAFPHMSLVRFERISMNDEGLFAEGRLGPSLPLLEKVPITVTLQGQDLTFRMSYSPTDLNLPIPGVSLDSTTFEVSYGSSEGFGAGGEAEFSMDKLGKGKLAASATTESGFKASGQFDFDSKTFDPAQIQIKYENKLFSGSGTVGIPGSKVPGIKRATINASFSEDAFSATGEAELDIPGVEKGTLTVSHSEEQGFAIGGTFNLSSDIPGIKSGSISAEVKEKPDGEGYALKASGEAEPDVPGFNSKLKVEYDNGAIKMEAEAQYQKGMLDGTVKAGATNRTLDEAGNPTGEPGKDLIFYGGGELGLTVAPWLKATVGVNFLPNADIEVKGEVGLPESIEIFPRKEIKKDIFSIDIPIPIVPGIFAEIGGGLDASAGIGPGEIDELKLGIEYNPNDEANTRVYGSAHLNIPADAGLRLSVKGGIGLGIPAASVSGGLEVGGQLGIAGAAEAGVQIDWTPATGLELNAYGRLSAQPRFKFDVSGYVEVEALFFTIYENRWELASFEFGSDMTFGVKFPVHYKEGEPFDISLSDVEFEVPDISPRQLLEDLVDKVA